MEKKQQPEETHQPMPGDIFIQEARRSRARRFKVYVYRKDCWEQFGDKKIRTFSEQDVQQLTCPPWRFMGESEKRRYYRNAASAEECIPQFPHESGWNLKNYAYAPYFYEHITLEDAEQLDKAAAEQLYKIVCLQPYDHYHKNTYFVGGASLAEFLQKGTFTALLRERIVSIELVESMPPTDKKLL